MFGSMAGVVLLDKLKLPEASDTALRLALLVCALVGIFFRFGHAVSLSERYKISGTPLNSQMLFWGRILARFLWISYPAAGNTSRLRLHSSLQTLGHSQAGYDNC